MKLEWLVVQLKIAKLAYYTAVMIQYLNNFIKLK